MKVTFNVEHDEDGYPPVADESLWVEPGPLESVGVVASIPFFVLDVSLGDSIRYSHRDGACRFDELVARGGHSTVRIVCFDGTTAQLVRQLAGTHLCDFEVWENPNYLTIDVPVDVDYESFIRRLIPYFNSGDLEIEESCCQHA